PGCTEGQPSRTAWPREARRGWSRDDLSAISQQPVNGDGGMVTERRVASGAGTEGDHQGVGGGKATLDARAVDGAEERVAGASNVVPLPGTVGVVPPSVLPSSVRMVKPELLHLAVALEIGDPPIAGEHGSAEEGERHDIDIRPLAVPGDAEGRFPAVGARPQQ